MLDVLINQTAKPQQIKREIQVSDRADKPVKSLLKAVSWRIVGTLDTMIISYIITGRVTAALSIGSIEVVTKTILYYFHERVWAHIHRIRFNFLRRTNGRSDELEANENYSHRKNNRRIA